MIILLEIMLRVGSRKWMIEVHWWQAVSFWMIEVVIVNAYILYITPHHRAVSHLVPTKHGITVPYTYPLFPYIFIFMHA